MLQFMIAHNRIPWFDLSFVGEPTIISIAHERTVFKDKPGLQDLLRSSCILFILPNIEHAMFMSTVNLSNVCVDISGNNLTTKNIGCKIYIVVEITL
jgi:hypothetical protein